LALAGPCEAAPPCDEDNPLSPARDAKIILSGADALDETNTELRSFIHTGSLGRVDASVVSPRGAVIRLTAAPQLSRLSPDYGEKLKGVGIVAELASHKRPARVVVRVRQVCAQYFRNTFLYE
jgi:hypothetical protein